jgi:hypothetical protein
MTLFFLVKNTSCVIVIDMWSLLLTKIVAMTMFSSRRSSCSVPRRMRSSWWPFLYFLLHAPVASAKAECDMKFNVTIVIFPLVGSPDSISVQAPFAMLYVESRQ